MNLLFGKLNIFAIVIFFLNTFTDLLQFVVHLPYFTGKLPFAYMALLSLYFALYTVVQLFRAFILHSSSFLAERNISPVYVIQYILYILICGD